MTALTDLAGQRFGRLLVTAKEQQANRRSRSSLARADDVERYARAE